MNRKKKRMLDWTGRKKLALLPKEKEGEPSEKQVLREIEMLLLLQVREAEVELKLRPLMRKITEKHQDSVLDLPLQPEADPKNHEVAVPRIKEVPLQSGGRQKPEQVPASSKKSMVMQLLTRSANVVARNVLEAVAPLTTSLAMTKRKNMVMRLQKRKNSKKREQSQLQNMKNMTKKRLKSMDKSKIMPQCLMMMLAKI
jgi:hypothetical protein